jgi:hypothetical protein
MLAVFAAQDLGHQRGANKALWNGSAWHLCLAELYKHDLTDMNVRVLLEEGETLPTYLNCLSLTGKRVASEGEEEISMADFEGLDLNQQLSKALEENPMAEKIMQFFEGARHS